LRASRATVDMRPHVQLAAEHLFLRKQLALYLERQVKPRRAAAAIRFVMVIESSRRQSSAGWYSAAL